MKLYIDKPIIKQLDKDYQQLVMQKDLPYDVEGLKFIRTYNNLENVFEVKEFYKHLNNINQNLEKDYSIYSNDTHLNFDSLFNDYKACLKVLDLFKQAFPYPEIEYDKEDLAKLASLITEIFKDRLDYLNLKYKELYLSYDKEDLIYIINKEYPIVISEQGNFMDVIRLMCVFNIKFNYFKDKLRPVADREQLVDFIKDCTNISDTFSMVLRIYFRFMLINGYKDKNMIDYSSKYLQW